MRTRRAWVVFGVAAVAARRRLWGRLGRLNIVGITPSSSRPIGRWRPDGIRSARQRLTGLSTRWIGADEVNYRLGLCEQSLGHDEDALQAWSRVPVRSPLAEAAALKSARLEMSRGRLSAAEAPLARVLGHPGPEVIKVCRLLGRLYWEEGRTDENARRDRGDLATRQSARLDRAGRDTRVAPRSHRRGFRVRGH